MPIGRKYLLHGTLLTSGIALVLLAARDLHRVASDPDVTLNYFFNGDTLYPAALCQDLTADVNSLASWRFTGATDFYPDLLLCALAHWITGEVAPAMVLCTCTLFALLVLSAGFLLGTLTERSERSAHLAALLGLAAVYLLLNALGNFDNYLLRCPLMLTCHGGSTICVISGLAFVIGLLFADNWRWRHRLALAALFVQTALCMASDRLILVQLVVPTVAALAISRIVVGQAVSTRRSLWIGGTLLAAAVAGQQMLRLVQPSWEDVMHDPFSFRSLWNGLIVAARGIARQVIAGDVLHSTAVATFVSAVVYVATISWRRIAGRLNTKTIDARLFVVACSFVAMCVSSIAAATASGMLTASVPLNDDYQWTIGTRYFLPMFVLPFLMLSYTASGLIQHRFPGAPASAVALSALAAAAVLLVEAQNRPHRDGQDVWRYYPPQVRELDEVAERLGLRDGLGDHHHARVFAMLSRRGLRVRAIMRSTDSPSGCSPYPKLGNMKWYWERDFRPSFIVLYDDGLGIDLHRTPSRSEVAARFGEPAETGSAGGLPVLIYNRPADTAFRAIPTLDYRFIREAYSFKINEAIRFPGHSLPSKMTTPAPFQPRVAVEGRDQPGIVTDGPELVMRKKGVYRVRAIASSTGRVPNGRFEIALFDPARDQRELCGVVELPPGDRQEASLLINVDDRLLGRLLMARVYYHGFGTLEVHSIEVERSP